MTDPAIGAHAPQLLHAMVAVADLEPLADDLAAGIGAAQRAAGAVGAARRA